jgi:hypothetical protein
LRTVATRLETGCRRTGDGRARTRLAPLRVRGGNRMRAVLATLLLAILFAAAAPAQPAPHRQHHKHHHRHEQIAHQRGHSHHVAKVQHQHLLLRPTHQVRWFGPDTRPSQWCGWFMRQMFRVADREYNRAAKWAEWGRRSPGPRVGAVVVWRHHVGLIEGGPDNRGQWLVHSGNDGRVVRTRYMSLARAIAFRMP